MSSFGDRLKKERERQGITLEAVSLSTKIGVRMLRALEEEHFDQLPGGIFNKGFVRAYARHLNIDEEEAVADYLAASAAPVAPGLRPPAEAPALEIRAAAEPEAEPASSSGRTEWVPWGKLAFLLLLVAFGFALWGSFSRQAGMRTKTQAPAAKAAATEPGNSASSTSATTPPSEPPSSSPSASAATEQQPAADLASAAPAPASDQPATADATAAQAAPFTVLVQAREDSWIQITVDGREIMQDTLAATAQKSVEARREVVIKAGNIGGLNFVFNGKKLPVQGDYNEVKVLTFDPNGLQSPGARKPAADAQTTRPQA